MRRGWPIDLELGLAADLIHRRLVGQLGHELVRLDVDVLLAFGCLRRFHIASEELFRSLGSLLLEPLWVILALIGLEQLIRVGARRDDHGSIRASTEHSLVVHDVLRIVLCGGCAAIWVLVLLLLSDDARMGSETLSARA